jgi:hypothetical protein
VIKTLYGLPCACILAMKIGKNLSIRYDDIDLHRQKLRVGEEEGEDDFSMMDEIIGIQERIKKVSYKIKLHNK